MSSLTCELPIETLCNETFNNFNSEYNRILTKKCIKYNSKLIDKEIEEKFRIIKNSFSNDVSQSSYDSEDMYAGGLSSKRNSKNGSKYNSKLGGNGKIEHYVNNAIASLFGHVLKNFFEKYQTIGLTFYEYLSFNESSNIVSFELVENDGTFTINQLDGMNIGGLSRNFITELATELFDKNIFITKDDINIYFLNPDFKPDKKFIYVVHTITKDQDITLDKNSQYFKLFYIFIGALLSFILVNDGGLEHYLSSSIMALFITLDPLNRYDYIYFLKNDFPEVSTHLFKLLKENDDYFTNELTKMNYNDEYKLVDEDKPVTKINIQDYITRYSTFVMTKTFLTNEGYTSGDYDKIVHSGSIAYEMLKLGIPTSIKQKLIELDIPLGVVTSYLTPGNITMKIVRNLLKNYHTNMNIVLQEITDENIRDKVTKMNELFTKNILMNYKLIQDPPKFFDFIKKLLIFWSGSMFYNEYYKYKININLTLNNDHLPISHTCFYTIDLPFYTDILNKDGTIKKAAGTILFDKMFQAVSDVEPGIGLRGGKNKSNKTRNLRRY